MCGWQVRKTYIEWQRARSGKTLVDRERHILTEEGALGNDEAVELRCFVCSVLKGGAESLSGLQPHCQVFGSLVRLASTQNGTWHIILGQNHGEGRHLGIAFSTYRKLKCQSSGEAKLISPRLPPSTALHGAGAVVFYKEHGKKREQQKRTG